MEDEAWNNKELQRQSKKFQGKYVKKPIGLRNPHSVCYMNSFIQQLFQIRDFQQGMFKTDWKKNDNIQDDLVYQLKKTFVNLKFKDGEGYLNP